MTMYETDDKPSPDTILQTVASQRWAGLLPDIEGEVLRAKKQVEDRVFRAVEAGTLTQEASHLAWLEVHALQKMLRRFNSKAVLPQIIGETDNG
jgi:hypothetical protein